MLSQIASMAVCLQADVEAVRSFTCFYSCLLLGESIKVHIGRPDVGNQVRQG